MIAGRICWRLRASTISTLRLAGLTALALACNSSSFSLQAAETYELVRPRPQGSQRISVNFEAQGSLQISQGLEKQSLPMKVQATFRYEERTVEQSPEHVRRLRHYDQASARMNIGEGTSEPQLDPARRRIGVEVAAGRPEIFGMQQPLTRDDLDLLAVPGWGLHLDDLLPGKRVAIGEAWELSGDALARLLAIDAVASSDVKAVLGEVIPNAAPSKVRGKVLLAGHVEGAIEGVATEIDIVGHCEVDMHFSRVASLELEIREKRSIGHVGPGVDATAKLRITSTTAEQPQISAADASRLAWIDADRRLAYDCPNGRLSLRHGRAWHVLDEKPETVVFRMIDRGELVAQCQISFLENLDPRQRPTLEHFQGQVQKALGQRGEKLLVTHQSKNDYGLNVYRVVIEGTVEELPVQWHYYLVGDDAGRQVAMTFILERKLLERLGGEDMQLVRSVRLSGATATVRRPQPTTR